MIAAFRSVPIRWGAAIALVACIGLLSGCVMGGRSAPATVTVHDNATGTMPPIYPSTTASFPSVASQPAPAPQATIPGDGTFRIGADIQPGTYRSAGSESCYWARLSGLSGSAHDILANSASPGPQIVEIAASDVAFKSQLCPSWTLVSPMAPLMASSTPAAVPVAPAPARVLALPPGAQPCPASLGQVGSYAHSAVGTSVTSCPFAEQVRMSYASSGPPSPAARQIIAVSPVTGQSYMLTCAANGSLVTCNGGNDAIVYVY